MTRRRVPAGVLGVLAAAVVVVAVLGFALSGGSSGDEPTAPEADPQASQRAFEADLAEVDAVVAEVVDAADAARDGLELPGSFDEPVTDADVAQRKQELRLRGDCAVFFRLFLVPDRVTAEAVVDSCDLNPRGVEVEAAAVQRLRDLLDVYVATAGKFMQLSGALRMNEMEQLAVDGTLAAYDPRQDEGSVGQTFREVLANAAADGESPERAEELAWEAVRKHNSIVAFFGDVGSGYYPRYLLAGSRHAEEAEAMARFEFVRGVLGWCFANGTLDGREVAELLRIAAE